uniref:SDR family NAD(P)-dependent oxidoreductase n=1 Tax=Paractinoplanes polyasparticus TaxID=2856853 RepID=UPI001C862F21|nr:SDR family NAD(P)-dependent oxidoreductase [Actinoplanes polyasparticus]
MAATAVEVASRIDVVVNNAGVVFAGPLDAYSAEEAARQFDLNVLGAFRVNRAVVPHMRRESQGLLIQVSSTGDRVTTPFTGLYCASKAALASLTEAWRHELRDDGIESVSVQAAPHATELEKHGVMPQDPSMMAPYMPALSAFAADFQQHTLKHDLDPQPVADAVVALVEAATGTRPHHTPAGPRAQREAIESLNNAAAAATRIVATDMGVATHLVWRKTRVSGAARRLHP